MRLRAPDHGRALRAMQEAVDRELAAARTGGGRAAETGTVVVVTADRGLRERLDRIGVGRVGPSWLLRLLDGP